MVTMVIMMVLRQGSSWQHVTWRTVGVDAHAWQLFITNRIRNETRQQHLKISRFP